MKPDEFHYHEAMDRLFTIQTMINEMLVDHPAIAAHGALQAKILCADEFLADAYQACGQLRHELFPEGVPA